MQKQIKITLPEELLNKIERESEELGMNKSAYCYNILFEHIRKQKEKQ